MPDKDDSSRREKKSETIEARLPFTTKRALLARCKAEGKSVSEVVRLCVESYLASPTQTERRARQVMKVFKHVAGAAAIAGSIMVAHHGAMAQPDAAHFGEFDSNGDGRLSLDELTAAHETADRHSGAAHHSGTASDWHKQFLTREFAAAAGADGSLTPDEAKAFHDRMPDRLFAALDSDSNGAIERAELARAAGEEHTASIGHVDADGDGRITRAELAAAHAAHSAH
jgi:hypothetical protein